MECVSYRSKDGKQVVRSIDACNGGILTEQGTGNSMNTTNQLEASELKKKRRRSKKYYDNKNNNNNNTNDNNDKEEESRVHEDIQRSSASTYGNELKLLDPASFDSNNKGTNFRRKKGNIPYVKYSKTKSARSFNENEEKRKSFSIQDPHSKESLERRHLYAHEKKTIEFPSVNLDSHSIMEGTTDTYNNLPMSSQMKTMDSLETCNRNSTELNYCSNDNAHANVTKNGNTMNCEGLHHNTKESGKADPLEYGVSENLFPNNFHQVIRRNIADECDGTLNEVHMMIEDMNALENTTGVVPSNQSIYENDNGYCSKEYKVHNAQLYKSSTQPGFLDKGYSRKSTRNGFSNKRMNLKSKTCVANFVSKSGGSTDFKNTLNIQFSKTKMCPYMNTKEKCKRFISNQCPYAHDESELKPIPNLYKTTMCRNFMNNVCFKSKKECNFAHHVEELRFTDEFYKTTLCKFFTSGYCKADSNCRHAHGYDELKLKPSVHLIENNELNQTDKLEEEPMGLTNYHMGTGDIHLGDIQAHEAMTNSVNLKRKESTVVLVKSLEKRNLKKSKESIQKQESDMLETEKKHVGEGENRTPKQPYHRNSTSKKDVRVIKTDTDKIVASNEYEEIGSKENIKTQELRKKHSVRSSRKNSELECMNKKGEKGDRENSYGGSSSDQLVNSERRGEEDIKYINTKKTLNKPYNALVPQTDSTECIEKEESKNEESRDRMDSIYEKENEVKGMKSANSIKSGKSMKNKKNVANSKKNAINHIRNVVDDENKASDSKNINEKDINMYLKKNSITTVHNNNKTIGNDIECEENSMNNPMNDETNFQGMHKKNLHLGKISESGTMNMSMSMNNHHHMNSANSCCDEMNYENPCNFENVSWNKENQMNTYQKKNSYKHNRRNNNGSNMNHMNNNMNYMNNNMNYINNMHYMNHINKNSSMNQSYNNEVNKNKNKMQGSNCNNYNNRNYRNMNNMNLMNHHNYQKFGNFMNNTNEKGKGNKQESNHTYQYRNMNMKGYNGFGDSNKNRNRFDFYGNENLVNTEGISYRNHKGEKLYMDNISIDTASRNGNGRTFNNYSYDHADMKNHEDHINMMMYKKNMDYGNYNIHEDKNYGSEFMGNNTTQTIDFSCMNGSNGKKKRNSNIPKNDKTQGMQEYKGELSDGSKRNSNMKKNLKDFKNEKNSNDKRVQGKNETYVLENMEKQICQQTVRDHLHVTQNVNQSYMNDAYFPTRFSDRNIPITSTLIGTTATQEEPNETIRDSKMPRKSNGEECGKNNFSKDKKKDTVTKILNNHSNSHSDMDCKISNSISENEYAYNEQIKVCSSCYQYIRKESTPEISSVESSCLHCGQLIKKTFCQRMIELIKPQVQYMLSDVNFYVQCYED